MTALAMQVAGGVAVLASSLVGVITPVGGLLGTFATLVGMYIALRANARTARLDYQREITDAERRGEDRVRAQLEPVIDGLREQARRDDLTRAEAARTAAADLAFWRSEATKRAEGST